VTVTNRADDQTHLRWLRCDLSPDEVADRADMLAQVQHQYDTRKAEAALAAREAREALKALDAQRYALASAVRDRAEYRDVECQDQASPDHPHELLVVRLDTGEVVHRRPMTEDERQRRLFPRPVPAAS
jgi:hypothetical protein